jgi:hypothetical protein
MSPKGYTFHRLNDENLKDLIYLMKSVHGKSSNLRYFKKKFDTKYTGVSNVGYFAYDELGEPAAFFCVFPCFFRSENHQIIGAQAGDTITNPKHQRKGLFYHLAMKTQLLAKEEGIKVLFCFPNEFSGPGFFDKLKWKNLGRFHHFEGRFNNLNFYNILSKFKLNKLIYRYYFKTLLLFIKSENFNSSDSHSGSFHVDRTPAFFLNKQYENSYFIKINRYKLWVKFEDGIIIGDIEKFDLSLKEDFFKKMNRLMKILGVKKVSIDCMENSFLHSIFNGGFQKSSSIQIGFNLIDETLTDKNVLFSGGDSDTF